MIDQGFFSRTIALSQPCMATCQVQVPHRKSWNNELDVIGFRERLNLKARNHWIFPFTMGLNPIETSKNAKRWAGPISESRGFAGRADDENPRKRGVRRGRCVFFLPCSGAVWCVDPENHVHWNELDWADRRSFLNICIYMDIQWRTYYVHLFRRASPIVGFTRDLQETPVLGLRVHLSYTLFFWMLKSIIQLWSIVGYSGFMGKLRKSYSVA